jgi:hypothetical protein
VNPELTANEFRKRFLESSGDKFTNIKLMKLNEIKKITITGTSKKPTPMLSGFVNAKKTNSEITSKAN